ncbi:hypothetical protein YERSI8AC_250028 [Enterobacterales bacterium 8AC]|nr:hypothetical protein YERSI8AC_250028 [Enterobacterales bacterium 8AC]
MPKSRYQRARQMSRTIEDTPNGHKMYSNSAIRDKKLQNLDLDHLNHRLFGVITHNRN